MNMNNNLNIDNQNCNEYNNGQDNTNFNNNNNFDYNNNNNIDYNNNNNFEYNNNNNFNYDNNNNNNNNIYMQDADIPDINELICDQKQFIDDDYLLNLHKKLAQTRELRKISENGVKILNGRVRCLKDENQKTLAKINIPSKKTNDKLLTMERKKSQSKEKMERARKLENELFKLKEKNLNQKVERDNGLINSRKKVISENKMKGILSKKEKKDIDNIKIMNELNEKNLKKNKIEVIRSQAMQKNQKKKIIKIEKKEGIIKDLEAKINYEIKRKKELDREINKMLKDESETLERINQTNEMQKKIFEDFKKILNVGNGNYIKNSDKFLMNDDNYENIDNFNDHEENKEI